MYIYEGHLGNLYVSDNLLDYEEIHCYECGDSDWLIGKADTRTEAWNLLEGGIDINGSGGWDRRYVENFINSNWIV